MLAVDAHNVSKTHRRGAVALRGIDLEAGRGRVLGLIGPNAAGKTTRMRILGTRLHCIGRSGSESRRPCSRSPWRMSLSIRSVPSPVGTPWSGPWWSSLAIG